MPESKRAMSGAVDNGAQVAAVVGGPTLVQLFSVDGRSIYVEEPDVEARLNEGYRLEKPDPSALADDLLAQFDTAKRAVAAFWKGVKSDGVIDPADEEQYHASEVAVGRLIETYGRFREQCLAVYPLVETAPETHGEGDEALAFDPSQVLLRHELEGYRAVSPAEVEQRQKYGWEVVAKGSNVDAG